MPTPDPARRTGLIDVHTHVFDPRLPDFDAAADVPTVAPMPDGRIEVRFRGSTYRILDERSWSPERRLRDMDADGVDVQVLSATPITYGHTAPAGVATALARHQNDFLARMVASEPSRFAAFGSVPLQDPAAAVSELEHCVTDLGFWGIAIGTQVGDRPLCSPAFEVVWEAASRLGAVVFVHPVDHCVDPRIRRAGATFGLGMPVETSVAATSLLLGGVLDRHSSLRVCLAHGGGALPVVLPRLAHGQEIGVGPGGAVASVLETARRLWCDSLTYDAASLILAAQRFGDDHIILGTDYPFAAQERPPGAVLEHASVTEVLRGAVQRENAISLFGRRQISRVG